MSTPAPAVPDSAVGAAVCAALRREVEKLGLSIGDEPHWQALAFEPKADPFSGEVSLVGTWRGKARFGSVTFFPDGRIFAEYQVLLAHPTRSDAYVEAVQVWGTSARLRGDAVVAEFMK